MSNRIGCMACSGDLCIKCKFWVPEPESPRYAQWWGVCQYFNDNPGAPRRIYTGNIKGIEDGVDLEKNAPLPTDGLSYDDAIGRIKGWE